MKPTCPSCGKDLPAGWQLVRCPTCEHVALDVLLDTDPPKRAYDD